MTFVGKILVIVVMAFSLIFLGISTVTLSTAKDCDGATNKVSTTVKELDKKLKDVQAQADAVRKVLDTANAQLAEEKKALEKGLANIKEDTDKDLGQIKTVCVQLATTHQKAKDTMEEVEANGKQTNDVRGRSRRSKAASCSSVAIREN